MFGRHVIFRMIHVALRGSEIDGDKVLITQQSASVGGVNFPTAARYNTTDHSLS